MRVKQTYIEQRMEGGLVLETENRESGSFLNEQCELEWESQHSREAQPEDACVQAPSPDGEPCPEDEPTPVGAGASGQEGYADTRKGARNKALGKRGEDAAARYLLNQGYEILERNWECAFGEADVIARDDDALVFVEVKTRTNIKKGFPAEAVGKKKQKRYEKIAACYLHDYDCVDIPVRFDVIALLVVGEDRALIKHYVNAFGWER